MAKAKGAGSVPNKALYSRVSYLYQAATFLATQNQQHSKGAEANSTTDSSNPQRHDTVCMTKVEMRSPYDSKDPLRSTSRLLISDLRGVSLKAQLRMSSAIKKTICKNCNTLLIDGSTCTSQVENNSKGGKKAWADILVRTCITCQTTRRYPLAAKRQKRRPRRCPPGDSVPEG